MKYIKRLFPLLLLLALLVGCFAFPVSAGEYDDFRFGFIDVFGTPDMFTCSVGETWNFYFSLPDGEFSYGEDYVIKAYANHMALFTDRDNDGVDERYRLVYNTSTGLTFVNYQSEFIAYSYEDVLPYYSDQLDSQVLQAFDHYDLECKLNFNFEGTVISLLYPSNVWFWKDIVSVDAPEDSFLGDYCFEVSGKYVYLIRNMPSGDSVKYMLLNQWNNPVYSTDCIFSVNSAESPLITLSLYSGDCIHTFTEEIGIAPTCVADGLKLLTCVDCSYSTQVVMPATGHNMTLVEKHTAKCPELGYKIMQCSGCSKTEKVVLPIEHTYTTVSCTQNSYCPGCGHIAIMALGHDRDIWGTCRTCGSNAVSDFFTGGGAENSGGADNSGGDNGNADGGAGGGGGNDSDGGDSSSGGFLDRVRDALNNAGNAVGTWWNDLWDKEDKENSSWFPGLKEDIQAVAGAVVVIVGGCVVIVLLPVLAPLFKAVGKGIAFVWNSLKDLFKAAGKAVRKASRSRTGKNKNKKRKGGRK